ncbi:MAG: hypothetical protein LLF80_05335 [Porphyromonadaceae bacterium]|nr:hypothetical protein [Porphyromonadaceae bacterium]
MGTFFFYSNKKPRKFNYTPILHNPEEDARKDRLQSRIETIKKEMGVLPELSQEKMLEKKDFKAEFISQTRHLKKRKMRETSGERTLFANNGLLIIILIILIIIFFFWFLR